MKHGRYSTIRRPRLQQLLGEYAGDEQPLDTLPEIQLLRALVHDYVERHDERTEALLAWHASWRARNGVAPAAEEALRRIVERYEADFADREGHDADGTVAEDVALARQAIDALAAPDPGKPTQVPDLADVARVVDMVTRAVERIEKVRQANAISRADLGRLLQEFERAVRTYAPEQAQRIREAWLAVHL